MPDEEDRWAVPLPSTWGDRARSLALPILLVAVASLGVYRSVTLEQSSWQGASFGMFATYDNVSSRAVIVRLIGPDGPTGLALPPGLDDDATRLEVVPTDRGARDLARKVSERPLPEGSTAVEVDVLRIVVTDDLHLRFERIASGWAGT